MTYQIKLFTLAAVMLFLGYVKGYAQSTKIEIKATGLTCSMCTNSIYKQLKTIPNVKEVETDLNTNTFIVTMNENKTFNPYLFREKVEKAGFFVGYFVATAKASTLTDSNYVWLNEKPKAEMNIKFQIMDKGFVTDAEYKKQVKSYKTVPTYAANNEKDFHIKIVK